MRTVVLLSITLFSLLALKLGADGTDHRAAANAEPRGQNAITPYGIEKRAPWTTSRITGSLEPPQPYKIERSFPNLKFDQLVDFTTAPGSDRFFVVEVEGKVSSFRNDPGVKQPDLLFDLKQHIPGFTRVYAIAFHPDFEKNRYVYLSYVMKDGDPKGSRVSRFRVQQTDPPVIDPASETVIIEWYCGGHNGCCLKFGPEDGCLYFSTGDGSNPSPPDSQSTGQNVSDLLACILRVDVDHPDPGKSYGIPQDNPFVDFDGARPEIWAYGFRNPWRMSFDHQTGWLWVGDVGWEMWEMIYRVERGGNYGWSIVEGPQSVRPELEQGPTPILPPAIAHSHIESRSITGGYVYRGQRYKELQGEYVYGDYVTGKIWGVRYDGQKITAKRELVDTSLAIVGFGEDHDGELFILGHGGTLNRLVPNENTSVNRAFPKNLSETGLFASVKNHKMAAGVIPYSINAQPWADGAVAERSLAVPHAPKLPLWGTTNTQRGNISGNWNYPIDSVFSKTLSLEMETGNPDSLRRLETQILHRHGDNWQAYTYIWNDQQTDAVLAPAEGLNRTFTIIDADAPNGRRQQTWHFAARTECLVCHTTRGGSIYGFTPPQLNRDQDYSGVIDNQLRTLVHIGLFDDPYAQPSANPEHRVRRMTNPFDETADLGDRARAYLYVNCGQCHRRGGGGTAKFVLLYHLDFPQLQLVGERPSQGTFNIHAARNVAAGDPYHSVLYYRMAKLGNGHMPKLGSSMIDRRGLRLIHDWIDQLAKPDSADTESETTQKLQAQQLTAVSNLRTGNGSAEQAIEQLLSSASGALVLLAALDEKPLSDSVQQAVIEKATSHPVPEIRGLFERFIPEEQRVKRLGSVIQPAELLALKGDAARGRQVFFNTAGVECKNCHRINEDGKQVGPDLNQIGKKYTRAQLLETILEPSKKIEKKYLVYLVETKQGRVFTGLLDKRTSDEVVLKDNQGKLTHIPADDVELFAPQRKSLMPELLLREMTAPQVADLLEYLETLK